MPSNNFKLGEMLNKRSPNSKTWINFDGSYTTEIYQSAVHFEDYEGNLHNIDTDLFDEADLFDYDGPIERHGKNDLDEAKERSRAEKKASKMNRDNYDFQGLKVPFAAKLPRNFKRGYKIGHGANVLKFKPVGASPSKGYVDEDRKNCIHYQDAWNDADVCLELTEKGIKETIIIKTDRAPYKYSFEVMGSLEDDLTSGNMKLAPAWLEDAEGTKRDVSQTIRRVGEDTFIDLEADVSGLVYPIYIDPTVTIDSTSNLADAYVYSDPAYVNSNFGTGNTVSIGMMGGSIQAWGLFKFDISSIPTGAVVNKAEFNLQHKSGGNGTGSTFFDAFPLNASFSETTVTWNNKPAYDSSITAQTLVDSATVNTYVPFNIKPLIDKWLDGTKVNNGFVLRPPNVTGVLLSYNYATKEWSTVTERPKLTVTYNAPPSAPQVTAPNGGETWNSNHTINWNASSDAQFGETTVLSGNFSLGGNGGKKIVKLDNGWKVSSFMASGTNVIYFYVLKPNASWVRLCTLALANIIDYCIEYKGNKVYVLYTTSGGSVLLNVFDATTQTDVDIYPTNRYTVDSGQGGMGNVSMAFNDTKTELHPTWHCGTPAVSSVSYNIRYRKITVASDGTPTLGTVEQITNVNGSGSDFRNPTVYVYNGNPYIVIDYWNTAVSQIFVVGKTGLANAPTGNLLWRYTIINNSGAYIQANPNALYIPQSINGLTNGRIEVVWQGRDATDSSVDNIRYSYSDDGGVTWVTAVKLTTGNVNGRFTPQLTVNSLNKLMVLFHGVQVGTSGFDDVLYISKVSGTWGSVLTLASATTQSKRFPRVLVDLATAEDKPTFVYQENTIKIGYFGLLDSIVSTYGVTTKNGGASYLTSNTRIGQTFKMPASGYVRKISLYWTSSTITQPNTKLELVGIDTTSRLPNGTVYSSVTTPIPNTNTDVWLVATLPTPIFIPKDTLIGIQMNGTVNQSMGANINSGNLETTGEIYRDNTANFVNGSDLCFQIDYDEITPQNQLQYHIQLSTNNGGAWKDIVALTTAGATSYNYDFINEAESSLCKIRIRAYDGSAYGPYDESDGVFTLVHNQAPNAPTNLNPTSGYKDRAVINRLSWVHSDPNGSDPQSKFDLQYRLQGAGSWTTVSQTTPNNYYDMPANTLPVGVIEWQVRTYDQAGLSGPYSATVAFNAANKPAPATFVTPADGAVIAIAKPVIQWSHPAQTDYDVKVMDATGTNVIWEEIKTSTNKAVTVGVNLSNSTNYQIKVAVKDANGLWSNYTIVNISISYTPPPLPVLSTTKDDERGSITLLINNPVPTGTEPQITNNDVYRRENGGEWIKVAVGISANGSFTDYEPKPNTSIEFYVIAYGENGTYRQSGVTSQIVAVAHTQLSLVSDPSKYVTMRKGTTLSKSSKVESQKMQFVGREFALTEFGTQKERSYDYSYKIFDWSDLEQIEELAEIGETLLLRDNLGRKEYVTIDEVSVEEGPINWDISIKPTKVYYVEGV